MIGALSLAARTRSDRSILQTYGRHDVDERVDILGVGISAISRTLALATIAGWVKEGERRYVCVTGVHGVMESQRDRELMEIHNRSGLTVPDGAPMVWCGRLAGAASIERMRGSDFMLAVCERAAAEGWACYFYGGRPGTPELLAARLSRRFPTLRVVGTHSPPFRALTAAEEEATVAKINASGADLVWVGLSTPKQERWMAAHRDALGAAVLFGVGMAFDVHAGLVAEAPRLVQNSGLEWLYRLIREPRRLWRRYLRSNPAFVLAIARHPPFMRTENGAR